MAESYEACIGLEVHAELLTRTKLFCGCSTAFGAEPNTQTCPVCLGMPGVLPVMNRKAFDYVLKTALAFNCNIPRALNFDRKNYYYPDLPKNYQISQNYLNIGTDGCFEMDVNGEIKRVRINNVHLEEDAGKNIHGEGADADYSFVDLNRAGVPLVEIVTAPDMHAVEEVEAFLKTMRSTLLYLGVSDCKMQEGSLRFEASVSVRPEGAAELGKRVEIKNLNSITAVLKVVEYEIKRQSEVLDSGGEVLQETRLWNEETGKSERMRAKEESHDYRYFPEPDLVWVRLDDEWIERVRAEIPELPAARRHRFVEQFGISHYDAGVLTDDKSIADYFEACVALHDSPKALANWIINDVLRELNERGVAIADLRVSPEGLVQLVKMVQDEKISTAVGREVLKEMAETGKDAGSIVEERGLVQISDEGELESAVKRVIDANPQAVADFKSGKKKAIGFLIGQVMRETKGKANAKVVTAIIQKLLG